MAQRRRISAPKTVTFGVRMQQLHRKEQKEYWQMVEQMGGDVPEEVKQSFEGGSDSDDSDAILSDSDEDEDGATLTNTNIY